MKKNATNYHRHRFPPAIIAPAHPCARDISASVHLISHAVSLCYRFTPSLRDIKDLLAERGVIVFLRIDSSMV